MPPHRKVKSSLNKARAYRRQRKVQLSNDPDQLMKERRIWEAARAREKRAKQGPIEAAARRWRDAQRARERRAKMTSDQLKLLREKDAVLKRKRRAMETEEQRAIRRSLEAQKARDRRASMPSTTTIKKMGMLHFMELAERTDIRLDSSVSDPLQVPNDENVGWIKQEVDTEGDEFSTISEMCIAALANIPVKLEVDEKVVQASRRKGSVGNDPRAPVLNPATSTPTNSCNERDETLSLNVNGSSNESDGSKGPTSAEESGSDERDGDSRERIQNENTSDPVLKIIRIETLMRDADSELPKFGEADIISNTVDGTEAVEKVDREENLDDEEFKLWEEKQRRKEIFKNGRLRNTSYQCDICKKFLSSRGNMRLHKMKRHKVKTPFGCKVCGFEFDYRRDLVQHRNKAHRNEQGLFECRCGKTTYEFHNFLTHMTVHSKPQKESSESKNEDRTSEDDLNSDAMDRTRTKNGTSDCDNNRYVCEHCGKSFKRPDSLKTHLNMVHMEDGGELAERTKNSIQEKNFVCDLCGRRFGFQCLLRDHLNVHSGLKPYTCPECARTFSQKASLKQHLKAHTAERRFRCVECPGAFFSRGDLTKHVRKHTGERPYICEVCGEGYAQSSHLNVHRRSHSGDRPFTCDLCGRGFTKSSDVVRHRRIHTGELPFLCQVCGRGFRQSAQCQNHIKNHHPETVLA